jgi:hypothetical protein
VRTNTVLIAAVVTAACMFAVVVAGVQNDRLTVLDTVEAGQWTEWAAKAAEQVRTRNQSQITSSKCTSCVVFVLVSDDVAQKLYTLSKLWLVR